MDIKKTFILVLNFGLIYYFTSQGWVTFGVICTMISVVGYFCFREKEIGLKFINSQLVSTVKNYQIKDQDEKDIILTIAFITVAMKIWTAIALYIEIGAIILLTFALILASGYLFDRRGLEGFPYLAYLISKTMVKIFNFLTSLYDRIAEFVVKVEFAVYKLDKH